MTPPVVTLEAFEVFIAGTAGLMRRTGSLANRTKPKDTGAIDRWTSEIEGACGEYAVAKLTETFWNPYQRHPTKLADCGDFHVRHTVRDDGCLILHDDDPDAVFVLVTGRAPTFVVRGSKSTAAGRDRVRYWRDDVPVPAYFVPQDDLDPFPPTREESLF